MFFLLYQKGTKDVSLADIVAPVIERSEAFREMEKADEMKFKRSFQKNPMDFAEVLYYRPDNTMSVNEIAIVKTPDDVLKKEIEEAYRKRIDEQKKNFDGYGTNQTYLLEHAVTFTDGDYVCLFIGENADALSENVRKSWEE